jgi:hypothetical protein
LRVRPVCYFFKFRGRSRWNKLHFYILQRMRRDITVRSPVIFASTTIKNVMNVVARGKKALGRQINKRMVLFTL